MELNIYLLAYTAALDELVRASLLLPLTASHFVCPRMNTCILYWIFIHKSIDQYTLLAHIGIMVIGIRKTTPKVYDGHERDSV